MKEAEKSERFYKEKDSSFLALNIVAVCIYL